jgi:protein-S-isoprenylcysteine O-methyltransferase Ste14
MPDHRYRAPPFRVSPAFSTQWPFTKTGESVHRCRRAGAKPAIRGTGLKPETRSKIKNSLRTFVVVIIVALFLGFFLLNIYSPPPTTRFEKWYGNWPSVITATGVFLFFLFFLTRPRRRKEWQGAGLTSAFFISLFTEMFGIPLTIYLIAPHLGADVSRFGMHESHLWAYLISRAGNVTMSTALRFILIFSAGLLLLGFTLIALGWKDVYRGAGGLVTDGLYSRLRHPQYLGLILVIAACLIQWPTVLTIILAPFMIARYLLLAQEEDRDLEARFGETFSRYKQRVPGLLPLMRDLSS